MSEKVIAHFCAPALAGIKPSNIISCRMSEKAEIYAQLEKLNARLNKKDIYFEVLSEGSRRILIMVYRKKTLEKHLKSANTAKFLYAYGYDTEIGKSLETLKSRLKGCEFPHEIGAFLGYPINDIYAFINHRGKGCLLTGEWKVYENADKARELFRRYNACRCAVVKRIEQGRTLAEIFNAAQ